MTTQPTPPEGYRLMTDEENPSRRRRDYCYDPFVKMWFKTCRKGDVSLKTLQQSEPAAVIFYARKIKG